MQRFNNTCGFIVLGFFVAILAGCGGLTTSASRAGSGGPGASESSDESDVEATYTSAVETLVDSANSTSSDGAGSGSSLIAGTQYLSAGLRSNRFRCVNSDGADQTFSCLNADGSVTRTVTFTECELQNAHRDVTLNGSFTNTVVNGGDGLCNADDSFDFSKMVMGREEGDAVHDHETGVDGMVFSFVNALDKTVTVTNTSTHTVTYTEPLDDDEDGAAESVTATVERDDHFVHTIDDQTAHDVNVFTTAESFVSISEEGSTETTVTVSLPVHTLTFDEDTGLLSGRTIESGNLIVDHNLAQIRMVFGVGEEGLTFDDGTTCGPVDGTMTVTGYTINDDSSIGDVIGTGAVSFTDGEVQSADFDGEVLDIRPRPCH